jgi:hypothetical protein
MPDVTIASAVSISSFSLMLHPNLFQLFQPMGGVGDKRRNAESAEVKTVIFSNCDQPVNDIDIKNKPKTIFSLSLFFKFYWGNALFALTTK